MKRKNYSRLLGNIRHRILKLYAPESFFLLPNASRIRKSVKDLNYHVKSLVSGGNASLKNAWQVFETVPGKEDLAVFPPDVVMEVKALACELPSERNLPFSRFNHAEIAREAVRSGIVASISGTTVWRLLSSDAIKPWTYRS